MALAPGSKAPDFTLQDAHGHPITMSKMRGTQIVLYFYPQDDTPGCTLEGREFSRLYHEFAKRGVLVFGVSRDSMESHERFAKECGIAVPLLSDSGGRVCGAYGVLAEKTLYGKRVVGISRTTFVIGPDGMVERVYENVDPQGHAQAVLSNLTSGESPS